MTQQLHFHRCPHVQVKLWWTQFLMMEDGGDLDSSFLPAMESQVDIRPEIGQTTPTTSPMSSVQLPPTPRHPHSTHAHDDERVDVEQDAEKARLEQQKKQRLNQLIELHESMIRVVKIGSDEFAAMDD